MKPSLINFSILLSGIFFLLLTGCNNSQPEKSEDSAETVVEVEETWIIDEHQYGDIPITSKAAVEEPTEAVKTTPSAKATDRKEADQTKAVTTTTEEQDKTIDQEATEEQEEMLQTEMAEAEAIEEVVEMEQEAYAIATLEALEEDLLEQEYEALASTVAVTEVAIPLEETQTVVSYNKKGNAKAAFQVVSNAETGEVEQIVFVDKRHRDVYDVTSGMSGKEVKRLRKELKHMVEKGKVFLYDDQSNIMYLMDAQNMVGDEITAADVESMEVQAIVWKDKKHHKKNKQLEQ